MQINREEITSMLEVGVVQVTFEKKDGTMRKMVATTNMNKIPKEHHPIGFGRNNETVKAVYDLEANGWRSFRWDSVKDIEVVA